MNAKLQLGVRRGLLALGAVGLLWSIGHMIGYWRDGCANKQAYAQARSLYYGEPGAGAAGPAPPAAAGRPASSEVAGGPAEVGPLPAAGVEAAARRPIDGRFAELLKRNDEIVGWIRVEGTNIDYPVLQAADNDFYLRHDVNKQANKAGSIFMDYRNAADGPNRNIVLYGHDMKDKTMFADLVGYESRWNFETKPIIAFDSLYEHRRWAIFSAYRTDTGFDYIRTSFEDDAAFAAFLKTITDKSMHRSDVEATPQDTILTLSTCSSAGSDARFVVHAKLIDPDSD